MTKKMTPETMLSLPRPGAAVPNSSGTYYIMPNSQFDFSTGRTTKSVLISKLNRHSSDLEKAPPVPAVDLLTDLRFPQAVWLDNESVLYLRPSGSVASEPDVDIRLSDKDFATKLAMDEQKNPGQEIWIKTIEGVQYKVGQVPVECA